YCTVRSESGPAEDMCCGYLRFFTDRATAEHWSSRQTGLHGTVLDQAAAERLGADVFGPLLTTAAAGQAE
ncbi:MAG: organomercurial lyase, partial [Actinomycetes bacterium]